MRVVVNGRANICSKATVPTLRVDVDRQGIGLVVREGPGVGANN